MHWIKSFIFYAFLTFCKVQAEIAEGDETQEMTQLSDIVQPVKNENQPKTEKFINILEYRSNYSSISNNIEVFKEKLGPQKEKQEEEPETEAEGEEKEEAQPDAEEPKEEEAGAEGEPAAQPEAEEAAEAAPEEEPATESTPEEPSPEEVPVEAVAEMEPEKEPEIAAQPMPNVPNTETDESEMPNDEPAKEQEKDEQDESEVSHVEKDTTKGLATKDTDKNQVSCFSCTSNEDSKCSLKPTQLTPCPKGNEGDAGKHNGCYTLYQVLTNITMRGCVDELAEEGLKYCLTNEKLCSLCYNSGCNNNVAPSHTTKLQFNIYSLVFLTIFSVIIKDFACLTIKKL